MQSVPKKKDVSAAAEIVAEYSDFIYMVICSQVKNKSRVDDIFQDFFISLCYTPIPQNVTNIKSYLYKAICNDIVDTQRRSEIFKKQIKKYKEGYSFSINEVVPKDALIKEKQMSKIFEFIKGRLTSSQSQAIALRFGTNKSIQEIAEQMGVKSTSVSRFICTGLNRMRQSFKQDIVQEDVSIGLKQRIFNKIEDDIIGLENANDDNSIILYHFLELEASLGELEEEAQATDRKYEARLAASLRDICRVYDPSKISMEQIRCFVISARALMKNWGKINKKALRKIRARLLEIGLTWLPITDKAASDISDH